jgi:hypothetical protein
METADEKIYHHTQRFYLLPWADANERMMSLGYGRVERSALTVGEVKTTSIVFGSLPSETNTYSRSSSTSCLSRAEGA